MVPLRSDGFNGTQGSGVDATEARRRRSLLRAAQSARWPSILRDLLLVDLAETVVVAGTAEAGALHADGALPAGRAELGVDDLGDAAQDGRRLLLQMCCTGSATELDAEPARLAPDRGVRAPEGDGELGTGKARREVAKCLLLGVGPGPHLASQAWPVI